MLIKRDGTVCEKGDWRKERNKAPTVIEYARYALGGEDLEVFARFAGVSHGQKDGTNLGYELGVTGNPKLEAHAQHHGEHQYFKTEAECRAGYNKYVSDLEAASARLSEEG